MISKWQVLEQVALRFGSREKLILQGEENLNNLRKAGNPLTSLEDNKERLKLRIEREGVSTLRGLERINNSVNFQEKNILDKLSQKAGAVCRILLNGSPFGTGFLISEAVMITNHHVIENAGMAQQMMAEFDYELDIKNIPKKPSCFSFDPQKFFLTSTLEYFKDIPYSGLDFTLIGVRETGTSGEVLSQYTPARLDGNQGKIIKGESCVIIQHPQGLAKKIVIKDTAFFSETDTRIIYESDTLPGSSGAMVVALGTGETIALHHSGLPRTDAQNRPLTKTGQLANNLTPDEEIDWIGNEGIKISKIIEALDKADVPQAMKDCKSAILRNTKEVSMRLNSGGTPDVDELVPGFKQNTAQQAIAMPTIVPKINNASKSPVSSFTSRDFLITSVYKPEIIQKIKNSLASRYRGRVELTAAMPATAVEGQVELLSLRIPFEGDANQEAQEILKIPEILNAEADEPLHLDIEKNLDPDSWNPSGFRLAESLFHEKPDWEEPDFLLHNKDSKYVKNKSPEEYRKWNWEATGFDKVLKNNPASPFEKGIRIVQFDTGYTPHSKVSGGFELEDDMNFLESNEPDEALDPLQAGVLKMPGHGTRTGSLLIGNKKVPVIHDGNCGLLTDAGTKLVPYRIAETVVIINRQKQLAAALDMAISQGFDIITMSMGLPPTIATAQMAKKAYEKGVIWCCASGNEVQFVVAPAVFPGTIAVAASNAMDRDWNSSSRGDAVDITAPGEDIYVPILTKKEGKEDFNYGSGTSYATPHIAAAAAYWLATYQQELKTEYEGWKRVEAFRKALKDTARKENQLPREGFGSGILDAVALLAEAPANPLELENAYNQWNEHAFFASIQGYGEMFKTYWNRVKAWIAGTARGDQEALSAELYVLSPYSQQIEKDLFPSPTTPAESIGAAGQDTSLIERMQFLHQLIEASAKS